MIITAGLMGGGMAAAMTKMAIKRMHIPLAEIYLKKGPVAWIKIGHEKVPFSIKPRNGYFVIYNNKLKGIFRVTHKTMYMMGKTPCWDYSSKNINPIDDVVCNELHKFAERNGLTKIKRAHIKQSQRLRLWKKRKESLNDAITELEKEQSKQFMAMEQGIENSKNEIAEMVERKNKELAETGDTPVQLSENQYSLLLTRYLLSKGLLDESEHNTLIYKIENGLLSFDQLITELRDANIVSINEPLDTDTELFLDDFGAQDPLQLSGHVDDLRMDRKNLKTMTATPVKQFIPASIIFAVFIGGAIAIIAIASNWSKITENMGGGFQLPFIGGGFISELIHHIPNFLMGLL